MIDPGLTDLAVDIDSVHPLPGNPRRGDVDAVAKSLYRFGQRKPVIATRDGTIIAGNHTHAAAVRLGWDTIAVLYVDDDETTAQAFALADNRTADLGAYDNAALVTMMKEVAAQDLALLEAASYTPEDLHDLIEFMDGPVARGGNGEPPAERDNSMGGEPSGIICPRCGWAL